MAAPSISPDAKENKPAFTAIDWQAADKVVRNVHEQKVQDCKDNLDGLLVFAGLYSAVLTAFLVESYKMLQPDPSSNTTFLLQQIVHQISSFSVSDNFINTTALLNSTAMSLVSSAFRPTANAERVNGLWFASLVLSLASASFCITIQQWLREFLAMGDADARYRLRIRHFRDRGLSRWRVYDIAAVLPLVIQVSLALFFVGLCFFTAEINKTIGHVTLTLVSAWAFLLVFTAMLPLTDPRCPYRVPFLRVILIAVDLVKLVNYLLSTNRDLPDLSPISRAECQAKNASDNDWEIVLNVASTELDDQLLADLNTLWKALHPSTKRSTALISFIRASIEHRITNGSEPTVVSNVLLPNVLSPAVYEAFIEMVASVVQVELDRQDSQKDDQKALMVPKANLKSWFYQCFYVLFTYFDYRGSEQVNQVVHRCLSRSEWSNILFDFLEQEVKWHEDDQEPYFAILLSRMKGGVLLMKTEQAFGAVMGRIRPEVTSENLPTVHLNQTPPLLAKYLSFSSGISIERIRILEEKHVRWERSLLWRVVDIPSCDPELTLISSAEAQRSTELFRYLLTESEHSQSAVSILVAAWGTDNAPDPSQKEVLEHCITRIFLDASASQTYKLHKLLIHIIQAIDPVWEVVPSIYRVYMFPIITFDPNKPIEIRSYPKLCSFFLDLINSEVALVGDERSRPLWKQFFHIITQRLRSITTPSDDDASTAQQCLDNIQKIIDAAQLQLNRVFSQELLRELERVQAKMTHTNATAAGRSTSNYFAIAPASNRAIENTPTGVLVETRPQSVYVTVVPAASRGENAGGEVGPALRFN